MPEANPTIYRLLQRSKNLLHHEYSSAFFKLSWNSWIQLRLQNELLEQIFLNNVFHMWGKAFIPNSENADIGQESDAKTHV
jgi:hypothetical protein